MSFHDEFQKRLDTIIGKKEKPKRKKNFVQEFNARHRVLIRFVCDLENCPSTITGKVMFAKDEDALKEKAIRIYGKSVVVKIQSQETIYDSDNN